MRVLAADVTDAAGTEAEPVTVEHVPGPTLGMRLTLGDGTEVLHSLNVAVAGSIVLYDRVARHQMSTLDPRADAY